MGMYTQSDGKETFDEEYYLRRYPELAEWTTNTSLPLYEHFVRHGKAEGRKGAPDSAADYELIKLHKQFAHYHGERFLAPGLLGIADSSLRRVFVSGACQAETMVHNVPDGVSLKAEYLNNPGVAQFPRYPVETPYDLHVIVPALRGVILDGMLWDAAYNDLMAFERMFEESVARLRVLVESQLVWHKSYGLPAFVINFVEPQANPVGRLLPIYDLRNPVYFVRKLNEELELIVRESKHCYVVDANSIAASIGRRSVQDDSVTILNHAGVVPAGPAHSNRIQYTLATSEYFPNRNREYCRALWWEVIAMFRTLNQTDQVKLVVFDLDDTLWNGVAAEMEFVDSAMGEGWPKGVLEALAYLKQRGMLLGVLSKNDEGRVREIWEAVYGRIFPLDWFAVSKINWRSKIDNMRDILAEVNLLPRSIVYVDDSPVERAVIKEAFPDIRVLDGYHYYWRKTLLWAPEMQVVSITAESAKRTEMVRAKMVRDRAQASLSVDEFRERQGMAIHLRRIDAKHAGYPRALELVNKTNQFNTTGRRWTPVEFAAFSETGEIWIFGADDNFVSYGIVGVVLINARTIKQVVMSCRVVGHEVEFAALIAIIERMGEGQRIRAETYQTDVNILSRNLFERLGFEREGEGWQLKGALPPAPLHVKVEVLK